MKKISLALIAALILAFMLTSCNQYDAVFDSNLNESLFDYKNEESISNASENEIEDNSQNISSVQNSDNANNNYLLKLPDEYPSLGALFKNEPDSAEGYHDFSAIEDVLSVKSCCFTDFNGIDTIGIRTSTNSSLIIYKMSTEEEKSQAPWYPLIKTTYVKDVTVCTSQEEAVAVFFNVAYKYIKEGIDIYWSTTNSSGVTCISFQIGDYGFIISGEEFLKHRNNDNAYMRGMFIEQSVYDKLAPMYEDNIGIYEVCNIYNDKSELIRILKECVAELNEDDTVTE